MNFSQLNFENRRENFIASLSLPLGGGYDWGISPDGRSVAAVNRDLSDNVVRILGLADKAVRQVSLPGWGELDYVSWAAHGGGLYLAANLPKNSALLHVDLKGNLDVIWRSESAEYLGLPVPSPDGKLIAFTVGSPGESNAWVIDQF